MTINKLTDNISTMDIINTTNNIIGELNGKQNTSNLVTSISASSTNAQYPSAKCMYDMIGNIETLLQGV